MTWLKLMHHEDELTLSERIILDSPKHRDLAEDSSTKGAENCVGKEGTACLQAICPFPTVFLKDLYCRHIKIRACLGKGKAPFYQSNAHVNLFSWSKNSTR